MVDQVTWTTPELAPPFLTTTSHQREVEDFETRRGRHPYSCSAPNQFASVSLCSQTGPVNCPTMGTVIRLTDILALQTQDQTMDSDPKDTCTALNPQASHLLYSVKLDMIRRAVSMRRRYITLRMNPI
ncbi:hypothetical protein TNCV_2654811 [Trichonephila clavipes]|nr:hypothetical protein TNCV_2654811 [Trichonephila clavipes]